MAKAKPKQDQPVRVAARLFSLQEWRALAAVLEFSGRELQIVQAVCDDLKEQAIARRLGISPHTVRTHFERLYHKLRVDSRSALLVRLFDAQRRIPREA